MFSKTVTVNINSIVNVKSFVGTNTAFSGTVVVSSERWVLNGKSIMGVFSLDLSKNIEVTLEADSEKEIEDIIAKYREIGIIV